MASQETGTGTEIRQRVVDALTPLLARLLERDEPVAEDMRLMDELGLDSSLALELLLELEEQLEIQIDVEKMDEDLIATVADMATFIADHCRPV